MKSSRISVREALELLGAGGHKRFGQELQRRRPSQSPIRSTRGEPPSTILVFDFSFPCWVVTPSGRNPELHEMQQALPHKAGGGAPGEAKGVGRATRPPQPRVTQAHPPPSSPVQKGKACAECSMRARGPEPARRSLGRLLTWHWSQW